MFSAAAADRNILLNFSCKIFSNIPAKRYSQLQQQQQLPLHLHLGLLLQLLLQVDAYYHDYDDDDDYDDYEDEDDDEDEDDKEQKDGDDHIHNLNCCSKGGSKCSNPCECFKPDAQYTQVSCFITTSM